MKPRNDKQLVVGLDIGTSKVVAIVGEYEPGEPITVIGIGTHVSRGMKRGSVVDIESTVHSIQRAVEEAELMAGCDIRSVYASISGSHLASHRGWHFWDWPPPKRAITRRRMHVSSPAWRNAGLAGARLIRRSCSVAGPGWPPRAASHRSHRSRHRACPNRPAYLNRLASRTRPACRRPPRRARRGRRAL